MKEKLIILFLVILSMGKVSADDRDYFNLHSAIFKKDLVKLERLLESGADPNIMRGNDILTRPLLIEAIRYGEEKKIQLVEILLRFGADPNLLPPDNRNPSILTTAVWYGYEDSFVLSKLLLFHEADPNIRESNALCSVSNFELLKLFIKFGGDTNVVCRSGQNLLHVSANISDNYDSIEYFINNGFAVNSADNDGNTALHLTLPRQGGIWQYPSPSIIATLLSLGADMNVENNDGVSALDKIQEMMDVNCSGGRTETQEICKKARQEAKWVFEYIFKQHM